MAKKAFIVAAILVVIIVIVSIIISLVNLKPITYQSVVYYDSNLNIMKEAPVSASANNVDTGIPLVSAVLKYDKLLMVSSVIVIIILALLSYGSKRSKG